MENFYLYVMSKGVDCSRTARMTASMHYSGKIRAEVRERLCKALHTIYGNYEHGVSSLWQSGSCRVVFLGSLAKSALRRRLARDQLSKQY